LTVTRWVENGRDFCQLDRSLFSSGSAGALPPIKSDTSSVPSLSRFFSPSFV